MTLGFSEDDVIRHAERVTGDAENQLAAYSNMLHREGYHVYSTAVANCRHDIEKALHKLVDALTDR